MGVLFCCMASFAGAGDKDTIPLKKKTTPTGPVGERLESDLLQNKKSLGGGSTVQAPPTSKRGKNMPVPSGPYVASVDTFGSSRINEASLRQFLGKDLDAWIEKGLKSDPTSVADETKLKEKVKAKWGFPYAEWSVIQYFEPGDMAIYITLDVVEKAEAKARMSFLSQPTQDIADPANLIQQWREYEDKAMELVEKGQLEPQATDCVALHCPFGHKHVNLKKYEKIFSDGVKKHESELVEVLMKDKDKEKRGAAAYLLAYLKDGRRVVEYMVSRIRDPEDFVRNNALRVLGDIAEFHREYVIPVKPVLEALEFPRVSDRSKAVYVAYHMATYSQSARDEILRSAIPDILKLLECRQPDHREFAHGILRRVSGKEFPPTDVRAWNAWWEKMQNDRGVAKKEDK